MAMKKFSEATLIPIDQALDLLKRLERDPAGRGKSRIIIESYLAPLLSQRLYELESRSPISASCINIGDKVGVDFLTNQPLFKERGSYNR